jgi:hypothetical protein
MAPRKKDYSAKFSDDMLALLVLKTPGLPEFLLPVEKSPAII